MVTFEVVPENRYTHNLNWQTWLKNGDQYLNAASSRKAKCRFGPDIRYNVLSMSFESYAMAILDYHSRLPDNHTYSDLMTALESVIHIEDTLKGRILQYENIQSICSLEKYHRHNPTEKELADLCDAVGEIGIMARQTCSELPKNDATQSIKASKHS